MFKLELGTFQGTTAKIYVDQNDRQRFYNPRPVPYTYNDKIEQELQCLQVQSIITLVRFSEWPAPIVSVIKSD